MLWGDLGNLASAGQKKSDDLVARCTKNGFWRFDKNFPDDQEEVEYLVYDGILFSAEDAVTNAMPLEGTKEVSQEELKTLTATGGLFNVGIAPGLGLATEEAERVYTKKMLADFREKNGADPPEPSPKKKKKGKKNKQDNGGDVDPDEEPEECESKEPLEVAKVFAARLLKYSTEARKGWQELRWKSHAKSLCSELQEFEKSVQAAYDELQALIEKSCDDAEQLRRVQDSVSDAVTWFDVEGRGTLEGFKRTLLKDARPKAKKAKKKAADPESNA